MDKDTNTGPDLDLINARLIDPETGYDGPGAVTVRGGTIADVIRRTEAPPEGPPRVECQGMALAPGIVDMRVFVGEPGAQHRESLETAGAA
ncbi:MAG: dihydroorotase, partial [Pseudomonadota bacterium]